MIVSRYDVDALGDAFGMEMSDIEGLHVGAGWGRIRPGRRSHPDRHDETETFVFVRGSGVVDVDGARVPVGPGTVIQFEPFETHIAEASGDGDLVFATFYWRDAPRAAAAATRTDRRRFAQRPVFVFSTPPTPNGDLHLGHLSGPYLGADVFVRFLRMNGIRAWHITGSDDFQSYTAAQARREDRSPAQTAARYSAEIAATLALMDIQVDQYTVTSTDATYRSGLQDFFSRLVGSGRVRPEEAPALFDGRTGEYLYEVDVSGTCPTCAGGTGGNICEECGEPNSCADLVAARSARSDEPPRAGALTRFSLPLHEFRAEVDTHHHLGRVPARLRDLAERLFRRPRLDIAMTHPAEWGVPPVQSDVDSQVIWVWPEMSYGFLHGVELLGRRVGEDWRAAAPQADWKIVHFFGFDNSFYHSVLYPVLYRLAYPDWAPDIDYHVNEFLLLDGEKFSTSRRHAIWGKDLLGPDSVDAVRFYLARIRPEGRRTNFTRAGYEAELRDTLAGGWQSWLADLGARIDRDYGGEAPDAGTWTPEHTGFLGRLNLRLAALANSLGPDAFSLNQAAGELDGIVRDAVDFARREAAVGASDAWRSETRTAVALELAAARLLAYGCAPVLPGFAARLAAALGLPDLATWLQTVELVRPGSRITLAGETFFQAVPTTGPAVESTAGPTVESEAGPADALLGWVQRVVRTALQLDDADPIDDRSLMELGLSSLQLIAVQYQIMERLGVDLNSDDLLSAGSVADLAALLARRADPALVTELAEQGEAVRL
jgi:methionyl-tRNA synthetase